MATRIYFQSSSTPICTPASDAAWEHKWNVEVWPCMPVRMGTTLRARNPWLFSGAAPRDILHYQFVCPCRLKAQTISGTVKGQFRCQEDPATADLCRALIIKVVNPVSLTVRGTLLSHFPGSLVSEFNAGYIWEDHFQNRYFPPPGTALTDVTCQDGDIIVIEIGARSFNPNNQSHSIQIGDASATDLPEDETATSQFNPWIEFSANLQWVNATQINATGVQAAYGIPPMLSINAMGLQVAYSLIPDVGTVQVNVMGAQVAYAEDPDVFTRRVFPVPNGIMRLQSQWGKRKFPICLGE